MADARLPRAATDVRATLARLAVRGRSRDEAALAAELPDLARALARAVAAGLPIDQAAERASAAVAGPGARLLRQAASDMRAGARPEAALAPLGAAPGGGLIAGAVALNAELGGDLVTALRALGDGLADRDRLRRELAASTAQARFAGRVVPVVPLAALALLWLMSPASVRPLLTTSIGLAVCATSAGLTLAALVAMRRILAGAEP